MVQRVVIERRGASAGAPATAQYTDTCLNHRRLLAGAPAQHFCGSCIYQAIVLRIVIHGRGTSAGALTPAAKHAPERISVIPDRELMHGHNIV